MEIWNEMKLNKKQASLYNPYWLFHHWLNRVGLKTNEGIGNWYIEIVKETWRTKQNPRESLHSLLAADVLLLKKATTECQIKSLLRRIPNEVKYRICI